MSKMKKVANQLTMVRLAILEEMTIGLIVNIVDLTTPTWDIETIKVSTMAIMTKWVTFMIIYILNITTNTTTVTDTIEEVILEQEIDT